MSMRIFPFLSLACMYRMAFSKSTFLIFHNLMFYFDSVSYFLYTPMGLFRPC